MQFNHKNIIVGITGSIAAYKSTLLIRKLVKAGARVKAVMTESATHFITKETIRTLTRNEVTTTLFAENKKDYTSHISLEDWGDCLAIAPATGNIISKTANGIADDFLSTLLLAFSDKPVLFAPAMNENMYMNPVLQDKIDYLQKKGYHFVKPGTGELACKEKGIGRFPEVNKIVEKVKHLVTFKKDFRGNNILITAGPTREDIDPIRFISNKSSGKMGYSIAKAASRRGGDVTLISGPTSIPDPYYSQVVHVESTSDMYKEVKERFSNCDILIMAAAVMDFKPEYSSTKIKKMNSNSLSLDLAQNKDILKEVSVLKDDNQVLVGFALETEDVEGNAREKLKEKQLDIIVANTPSALGEERMSATLFDRENNSLKLDDIPKLEMANTILDQAKNLCQK